MLKVTLLVNEGLRIQIRSVWFQSSHFSPLELTSSICRCLKRHYCQGLFALSGRMEPKRAD